MRAVDADRLIASICESKGCTTKCNEDMQRACPYVGFLANAPTLEVTSENNGNNVTEA